MSKQRVLWERRLEAQADADQTEKKEKPERVWLAWTRPEHLTKWFTPAPWSTAECENALRPGGYFAR